jgi:hypothetical protein
MADGARDEIFDTGLSEAIGKTVAGVAEARWCGRKKLRRLRIWQLANRQGVAGCNIENRTDSHNERRRKLSPEACHKNDRPD